jgi:hypothetical protein
MLISPERRTTVYMRARRLRSLLSRGTPSDPGAGGKALNTKLVEAAARELGIQVRTLPGGFLMLERDGVRAFSRGADFGFEHLLPWQICGDKRAACVILGDHGLPVARARSFASIGPALRYFDALGAAAVTKPAFDTSGAFGVSTNLRSRDELARGFARAAAFCSEVLVETHHDGSDVRITVLAGEVIGAVHRHPASVHGDGASDITNLVREKNERLRELRPDNQLLEPIVVDGTVRETLRAQGLRLTSVLPAGTRIYLRDQCNARFGGELEDVTERIHAGYLALAREAASVMGAEFIGADLICAELEQAPSARNVIINEVNTTPALYIVEPLVAGTPSTRPARLALERLFEIGGAP